VSVFDFTDPAHVQEIAYFDRGPVNADTLQIGGSWSAYWHNGYLWSTEIARGLDVLELTPSEFLSANEIAAARLVQHEVNNPQNQTKNIWPANFAVPRAYLDQLVRGNGLAAARSATVAKELDAAEQLSGAARRVALNKLATQLSADAKGAPDGARVRAMASAVSELAMASK
jgi:hypothetical protein